MNNKMNRDIDLHTLKELLGHKTSSMVFRYAHLSEAHKEEAINKLPNNMMDTFQSLQHKDKITVEVPSSLTI